MAETNRYVAYYRMPSIGSPAGGDTLARQRRDIIRFLDRPDRVLVGEFTEVMTPLYEGETSPAFDLSLDCCRNLDANLICALPPEELTAAARDKAVSSGIEIVITGADAPAFGESALPPVTDRGSGSGLARDPVPYLRLGGSKQPPPPPRQPRPIRAVPVGNRAKADRFAAAILPVIKEIKQSGATTLTDIADALNARQIRTARGRRWYPTTVKNILDRQRRAEK